MHHCQVVGGGHHVLSAASAGVLGGLACNKESRASRGMKRSASEASLDAPQRECPAVLLARTQPKAHREAVHGADSRRPSLVNQEAQATGMQLAVESQAVSTTWLRERAAEPCQEDTNMVANSFGFPSGSSFCEGGVFMPPIFLPLLSDLFASSDSLHPTVFDQLDHTLALQDVLRRLSDPLDPPAQGVQEAAGANSLQEWSGPGPAGTPALDPLDSALLPSLNDLRCLSHSPTALSRFIPVSGWEPSSTAPLPPAPRATALAQNTSGRQQRGEREETAALRREALTVLDGNAGKLPAPKESVPRKKHRQSSRPSRSDPHHTCGVCGRCFASAAEVDVHQGTAHLGSQAPDQWLAGVHGALERASFLATKEAQLRLRLLRAGVSVGPSGALSGANGWGGRTSDTQGSVEGMAADRRGVEIWRSQAAAARLGREGSEGQAGNGSGTDAERLLAFSGTFTTRGLHIAQVAPSREESVGEFLRKRVVQSGRTLAESVWRMQGRDPTVGPSPPSRLGRSRHERAPARVAGRRESVSRLPR